MTDLNETGLPAWPERRARRTAANAALADFRREYDTYLRSPLTAPLFDGISWSLRLADNLSLLIPCVGDRP